MVWFGEMLPPPVLSRAFELSAACQVFLSIGTSALVQPAASLPLHAYESGAVVVEINPAATAMSQIARFVLRGPAGRLVPALVDAVRPTG